MAKQVGTIKFTGTISGVTFYRMNGSYYARAKSSLSAKKVKTHPNFAPTRMYACWLGEASKMASVVYKTLPPQHKKYGLYCELKTMAYSLVKKEMDREQIMTELKRKAEGLRPKGIRIKTGGRKKSILTALIPKLAKKNAEQREEVQRINIPLCIFAPPRLRGSSPWVRCCYTKAGEAFFIPTINCLMLAK